MVDNQPADPAVVRRGLGIELHKHRETVGLTQLQAASALEWSLSKLVRIEKGAHGVSVSDLRALLQLYRVTNQDQIDDLTVAARGSRGPSQWSDYSDILTPPLERYLGYESAADELWVTHPFLLPGLLHTEDYASGLFAAFPGAVAAPRLVELRMKRQERIFARTDVSLNFIVGEEALYRWVGGPAVMRQQLGRLVDVGRRDNVTIRIVPFTAGSHPGLGSPFIMLRVRGTGDELLFVESVNGDQLIRDDPDQLADYAEYLEMMRELSVDGGHAETLLRGQIDRLRHAEQSAAGRGQ